MALNETRRQILALEQQCADLAAANTRQDRDLKSLQTSLGEFDHRIVTLDKYTHRVSASLQSTSDTQNGINKSLVHDIEELKAKGYERFNDIDNRFKDVDSRHDRLKDEVRTLAANYVRSPSPTRYKPSRDRDYYDYPSPPSSTRHPPPPPYSSYHHDQSRTVMGSTNTLVCPSTNISHAECKSCSESNAKASACCSGACRGKEREKEYSCEGGKQRRHKEKGYGSGYDGGLGGLVYGQYEGSGSLFGGGKKKGMFLALGGGGVRRW